jgi:GT2 family glycosyltransferase
MERHRALAEPISMKTKYPLPSVTTIVCAYSENRWSDLCAALASIEIQSHPPIECILVIDHNPRLLERSREAFTNVKVIENESEPGLAGARNSGINESSGDIIAFLDDDAAAEPHWLEELVAPYGDSLVVGTGGFVDPVWETKRPEWFPSEFLWVVGCSYRGLPESVAVVRNPIGASMSFRRSLFDEVGNFAENMGRNSAAPLGCEETEFAIRALQGRPRSRILYVPTAVINHHVGSERVSVLYFVRRCFGEGISKSVVARRVGKVDGLASERQYVLRVLPSGIGNGIVESFQGHPAGAARSIMILVGLAITGLGYGFGRAGLGPVATRWLAGSSRRRKS